MKELPRDQLLSYPELSAVSPESASWVAPVDGVDVLSDFSDSVPAVDRDKNNWTSISA